MTRAETRKAELVRYIKKEIEDNNFLGLVGAELDNMANTLATCDSRRELFDWCQTLMVGETVAAEVTKRRVDHGPPFDDIPAASATTVPTGGSAGGKNSSGRQLTMASKKGVKRRSTALSKVANKSAAAALQPGFCECGCFATKHELRGNCANCGRIICEQESDETCYTCGLNPSTCVAYEIKVQEGLIGAAALEKNQESYEAAVMKLDELLHYAETRAKRTKVIDDQTAVFLSPKHAWMSPKERQKADEDEALAERRRRVAAMHRARGAYRVHLDVMNQNVSLGCPEAPEVAQSSGASSAASTNDAEGKDDNDDDEDEVAVEETRALPLPFLMQKIWYSLDGRVDTSSAPRSTAVINPEGTPEKKPAVRRVVELSRRVQQDYYEEDAHLFREAHRERVDEVVQAESDGLAVVCIGNNGEKATIEETDAAATEEDALGATQPTGVVDRVTPLPAMRMNDDGICLSMHQPWAGLLVAGIKVHEGRVWPTDYRGRLWIHAASAQPHDIEEVERHYSKFMTPTQRFPKHYPTRVLLGYVYLVECVDSEAYKQMFTEEQRQEESPFTFICTEAKALPFPLPMNGDHKLFRLEHKVHTAARKQLLEIM
ncbi:thyroid hormone receptor interactor 4 [Trypanosoma rangeli]|uniref:Thyroid hormone receptor interactor 4 n=1 Tax=Trypanosoma rangeli TaxID=5698 RepID=A0A3S5IQP6_TRYRA|nr:thyroid hormone receptor interactor 4 [Trypanosoma rangeli]RNF01564.1 thyroid hormone receptor interactor 4 [Trypanosoma rangeli]|eukprot:RNF01564.1 thyroid hormone receptor interactor 4 [Trypanosoma rangeli]